MVSSILNLGLVLIGFRGVAKILVRGSPSGSSVGDIMGMIHMVNECSPRCPFFHGESTCSCFLATLNGYILDLTKKKDCSDKSPPDQCPLFEYGKSGVVIRMDGNVNRRQTCRG